MIPFSTRPKLSICIPYPTVNSLKTIPFTGHIPPGYNNTMNKYAFMMIPHMNSGLLSTCQKLLGQEYFKLCKM